MCDLYRLKKKFHAETDVFAVRDIVALTVSEYFKSSKRILGQMNL